ncbi:MAG TPA: NAD(P)/FAD-dependent oxidoreductase [Blastocatellia bacterium]|nr:NAD(P)/FAD-dependent oxidoreductase [Blastocatellia bacterium]HMX26562.1 NAD(P)/FAD-dependent oxidoreductase [Blastocatellia bacterium]HNG34184.1 NAD(P)/FAD-dependent oxidoreductase [Blastocatellia bacterium]
MNTDPRVVIIGAGFGGLTAAQALKKAPVQITVIDRTNHHLFQPLLYQVAMAGLSPADIAAPIRSILRSQKNVTVLLAEATGVDFAGKEVVLGQERVKYDYLLLATGGRTSYFGHDDWEQFAPGLKDLDDAVEIRRRVLMAFEAAEKESDPKRRRELLTFVVVGGGPTGVELAGAIAELSNFVLARDFRTIDPEAAEILLLEGGPKILPTFAPELSESALQQLTKLGAKVRTGAQVTQIDETGVCLGEEKINAATVIWGAGVRATALTQSLGVETDRAGRVIVQNDLSLPGRPNVFAIGDMTLFQQDGKPLPGVSPVAMQMGEAVARNIQNDLAGKPREEFRYHDKGSMATIGRKAAIAEIGKLKLTGFLAWLFWLGLHIWFLIGFRNRFAVMFNWAWSYFTYQRGARLITGRRLSLRPRRAIAEDGKVKQREGDYQIQ